MEFTNGDIDLINGNHVGKYEYKECYSSYVPYVIGGMYLKLDAYDYYIDDNGLRFDAIDDTPYGAEYIIKSGDRFYSLSTYVHEECAPREIIPIQTKFKKTPNPLTKIDWVRHDKLGFIYAHITGLRSEYYIINAEFITNVTGVDCDPNHSYPIIFHFADRSVNFAISRRRRRRGPLLVSYDGSLPPDDNLIHSDITYEEIETLHSMYSKYELIQSNGECLKIFKNKDNARLKLTNNSPYYQPVIIKY
jgi:hypothetical protein